MIHVEEFLVSDSLVPHEGRKTTVEDEADLVYVPWISSKMSKGDRLVAEWDELGGYALVYCKDGNKGLVVAFLKHV